MAITIAADELDCYVEHVKEFLEKKLSSGLLPKETVKETLKDLSEMDKECYQILTEMDYYYYHNVLVKRTRETVDKLSKIERDLSDKHWKECPSVFHDHRCNRHDEDWEEFKKKRKQAYDDNKASEKEEKEVLLKRMRGVMKRMQMEFKENHKVLRD